MDLFRFTPLFSPDHLCKRVILSHIGQFGGMSFNVDGLIGMMIAILASVLEYIGDYHACARICGAPPPPVHAILFSHLPEAEPP